MRILIVSQYYYPEQFQINEIAPELVSRGHEVTVVCGVPNYPKGDIFPGYEGEDRLQEVIDGVRVVRVRQSPRGHNVFSLIRNYFSFVREANNAVDALEGDFDVVLGYQLSPVTSMLPAVRYASRHSKPLLLYVLDIWPESALAHLPVKSGLIFRWLKGVSRKIYNSAARILVTSRPFVNYLNATHGVAPDRMAYLPQHASSEMIDMNLDRGRREVPEFMYAGNLGAGSNLDVIVKAASLLGGRGDYRVHFVGDGSQRQRLEVMVKELGLEEVFVFHGNRKREDMPRFYAMADALLLTLRGNNAVGDTMPGKLQMYMTTGKPILGAINGAGREVIEESGCGRCVPAGDAEGLAAIIKDFIENPRVFADCGVKGRAFFKSHFTLPIFMDALEEQLKSLHPSTPPSPQ